MTYENISSHAYVFNGSFRKTLKSRPRLGLGMSRWELGSVQPYIPRYFIKPEDELHWSVATYDNGYRLVAWQWSRL